MTCVSVISVSLLNSRYVSTIKWMGTHDYVVLAVSNELLAIGIIALDLKKNGLRDVKGRGGGGDVFPENNFRKV